MDNTTAEIRQVLEEAARIADVPESVEGIVTWAHPEDLGRRLKSKLNRLKSLPEDLDRPLRLAVCGENNAGKSTFINAFVGDSIAVKSSLEFTFAPMVFRHGARPRATIEYSDGNDQPLEWDQLGNRVIELKELGEEDSVEKISVEMPLDALSKYEIADLPGLGASERNSRIAKAYCQHVDGVIFLLNASLIGQSEMDAEIRELVKDLSAVAIVVNKMDEVGFENTERMIEFVEKQNFGEEVSIFPGCVAALREKGIDPDLPRQWMEEIRTSYVGRVSADAAELQARTALKKCLRDMASVASALQAAYHLGSRVFRLGKTVRGVLLEERARIGEKLTGKIRRWIGEEAFMEAAASLRLRFKEEGFETKEAVQASLKDAFSESAMDAEARKFAEMYEEAKRAAWMSAAEEARSKWGNEYSGFRIESVNALVPEEEIEDRNQLAKPNRGPEILSAIDSLTSDVVTSRESQREGTLSGGHVGGASAAALLAGGGSAAALASAGASATFLTALTGVGLPLAAATGFATLTAFWLNKKRNQPMETSFAELARIVNRVREDAAKAIVDSHLGNVDEAINGEVNEGMRHCFGKIEKMLWCEFDEERPEDELQAIRYVVKCFEQCLDEAESTLGNASKESAGGQESAASKRAYVLYDPKRNYEAGEEDKLEDELFSVLDLEDTQVTLVDRKLTGSGLERLLTALAPKVFVRALIYDAESDPETRSEFVRSLQRARQHGRDVNVRVVRFKNEARTPLDRVLIIGTDWAVEASASLGEAGRSGMRIARLSQSDETDARNLYLKTFGSIEALNLGQEFEVVDL